MLLSVTEHEQRLRVSAADVERLAAEFAKSFGKTFPPGKPLGAMSAEWDAIKKATLPGDEMWLVSSQEYDWSRYFGREQIELIRGGRVIAVLVTTRN